jgi:hypothetical protein
MAPHKQGWTKGANCYHGPLGIKFQPLYKANTTADCLEKQFTPHKLCEENHKRQVDARVQDLLEAVDKDLPETVKGLWN